MLAPIVVAAGPMEANAATVGAPRPEATSAVSAAALEPAVATLSVLLSSARLFAAVAERSAFSAGALAALLAASRAAAADDAATAALASDFVVERDFAAFVVAPLLVVLDQADALVEAAPRPPTSASFTRPASAASSAARRAALAVSPLAAAEAALVPSVDAPFDGASTCVVSLSSVLSRAANFDPRRGRSFRARAPASRSARRWRR